MFISVHHKISSPGQFWASAQKNLPHLPETGVKRVVCVFPSNDMGEATCIWEADSIEALNKYLRCKVFDWSRETYFEISASNAIGLPS
ncbi:MAG: hypothetical protein Q8941_08705 [Bacteroidota bacterium]|nr:hypothetical protein [Bacteroidota bacterium]